LKRQVELMPLSTRTGFGIAVRRRALLQYGAGLGLSAAGLALLDGCGQSFWDRRRAVARVGIPVDAPHDSAVIQQELEGFTKGMRDLGWVDGQNVVFHPYYTDEGPSPELAARLVGLPADVILVTGANAVFPVRDATSTIPIVAMVSDRQIDLIQPYFRAATCAWPGLTLPPGRVCSPTFDAKYGTPMIHAPSLRNWLVEHGPPG
jgi:hypothetical protein